MDHLRDIIDDSPTGLLLFESSNEAEEWHCIHANQSAGTLLGHAKVVGISLDQLLPNAVVEKLGRNHDTCDESTDLFLSNANRWVMVGANRVNTRMTIALTDVTQLKEASFADRRLMRLYKSLSNNLSDNEIILFDQEYNILLSEGSPRFIRLGLEGDLKGKNLNQLFETNPFTFLGEYVSKVFGGERADVEQEINGKFYKASIYSDRHEDDDQSENVLGILLIKDVSELNKKQRELEVRVQQLDRSNRELQEFAYVASHDLQEPLRKIMSFGERLTRKYGSLLTGEGQEYITRMNNAAERMETLINDLLSFSRAAHTDRTFETTNLNHIIAQVIADMDTVEQTKAQFIFPEFFPVIDAIPSQMRQLFQNLFNNALKFTNANRTPVVQVRCRQAAGDELPDNYALLPEKEYCIIEIEDNGIGFDQANAERIFTIFQRLHGRSEYSGTGVGLAICKKIVNNHQGIIFAKGREGEGALFTVILPLQQQG